MDPLNQSRIDRYRQQLRDEETPEPEPLDAEELHDTWQRGNQRRPVPPNLSSRHKADLVQLKHRWIRFAATIGEREWKALIKTLSFENKGLGESFVRYLMRQAELQRRPIKSESAIRVHIRKLGGLYRKYNGCPPEKSLMDHLRNVIRSETTKKWGLRREPKIKPVMGPTFFIYHLHYRWVRDTSALHIGLDRIDDVCMRIFFMWTGCRKHELLYAKPKDLEAKVKEYDDESDAYTDIDCDTDKYIRPRVKQCWVCEGVDERDNNPRLKVLCWEDIDFWIVRDPDGNGGRDRLAMQVLLRYHKGENNEIVPTWYIFIEETLPVICPVAHILAKAQAEGVIANEGYQTRAEPFFATKLSKPALRIRWKKEWLHKPVFRQTVRATAATSDKDSEHGNDSGGDSNLWVKSDDALTSATFDARSERLRIAMGLFERLAQYSQRRGYAECVDTNYRRAVRDQGMRHKPNSTVYQKHYHNAKMNAVVQDAFLGRGTQTPYLAIFNHMGLRLDENAPKRVPDEMMRLIGPNATIRRLEQKMEALQGALQLEYGRPSLATDDERNQYESIKSQLSAARQKHRRKVFRRMYKDHFTESDDQELQNQLEGIHNPVVEREVIHSLSERRVVADIMGDMDEDLPENDIVRRKVEAINAMVAYAFVCEPLQRAQPEPRVRPTPLPSSEVNLPISREQPFLPDPIPIQRTQSSPVQEMPVRSPPPPYSEFNPGMPSRNTAIPLGRQRSPYVRKKPDPCIFCGKTYTRTDALWDHLEDHLKHAGGGPLSCPRKECNGFVLESPGHFKAHAARSHGTSFRVRIKLVTPESMKSPSLRPATQVSSDNPAQLSHSGILPTPTRIKIVLRTDGKKA